MFNKNSSPMEVKQMKEYVPIIDAKTNEAVMVEIDQDDVMENKQTYTPSSKKCTVCKQPKESIVSVCCNCNFPKGE